MMKVSILYYKKFVIDIISIGFKINPYDAYIANYVVEGKQYAFLWHIDNMKSSHVNLAVNDKF